MASLNRGIYSALSWFIASQIVLPPMSSSIPETDPGLAAFAALLEAEYGLPLAHFSEKSPWTERESLQISRALGLLLKQPIASIAVLSPDAIAASETGARRRWTLDDAKIAGTQWEASWQWQLLADIDNAAKSAGGGMMTPSDPRLYLLTIRYDRDFFAILAGHCQEFLCDRPGFAQDGDAAAVIDRLSHIPGFQTASPAFIAGTAFLIAHLGRKGFCAWCEERGGAKDDGAS
jgi:hypothetical protein